MDSKRMMMLLEGIVSKLVTEQLREQLPIILQQLQQQNQLPQEEVEEDSLVVGNSAVPMVVDKKKRKRSGPPSLFEILATDEDKEEYEKIPIPAKNLDYGIYHDKMHKHDLDESKKKFLDPNVNPFSFIYEGMEPQNDLPQRLPQVNQQDARTMQMLAGIQPINEEVKPISKKINEELAEKERMLEARRAQLRNIHVNTGNNNPPVQQQQTFVEPPQDEAIFIEPDMPSPISFANDANSNDRFEMAFARASSRSKYRIGR